MRRREGGSASVELIGLLPLVLVVALLGWQLALAAVAASDVETAARNASRARAEGRDPVAVAHASLGPTIDDAGVIVVPDGPHGVRVSVPVPVIPVVPFEIDVMISRAAEHPELD